MRPGRVQCACQFPAVAAQGRGGGFAGRAHMHLHAIAAQLNRGRHRAQRRQLETHCALPALPRLVRLLFGRMFKHVPLHLTIKLLAGPQLSLPIHALLY